MAYSAGEYVKQIATRIFKELLNDVTDFLSVIPNAPKEAMDADGVKLMLLKQVVEAEIDRAVDYADEDVVGLQHEKDFIAFKPISTPPVSLSKDQLRDSAYDKKSDIRMQIKDAIALKFRDYVLNQIAPDDSTKLTKFPVLRTTGPNDGTGRKRLIVDDIINYQIMWKELNLPSGTVIDGVLCNQHLGDLQLDTQAKQYFRDLYHNPKTGKPTPIYNFNWWNNNSNVSYTAAGVKVPIGAAPAVGDQDASTFFWRQATMKALGKVTIQHKPIEEDTRGVPPKGETNAHGYVMAEKVREKGTGAIISGNI